LPCDAVTGTEEAAEEVNKGAPLSPPSPSQSLSPYLPLPPSSANLPTWGSSLTGLKTKTMIMSKGRAVSPAPQKNEKIQKPHLCRQLTGGERERGSGASSSLIGAEIGAEEREDPEAAPMQAVVEGREGERGPSIIQGRGGDSGAGVMRSAQSGALNRRLDRGSIDRKLGR